MPFTFEETNEMTWDEVETEAHTGGTYLSDPGAYHCQVEAVEEDLSNEQVKIDWLVVGPVAQCGQKRRQFLSLNASSKDKTDEEFRKAQRQQRAKVIDFAVNVGLITKEGYEAARAAGQAIEIDFSLLEGRQAICDFVADKYTDKQGNERPSCKLWPNGVKRLDDPKYVYVKLNPELSAAAGYVRPAGAAAAKTNGQAAAKPAAARQAAAATTAPAARPATQPAKAMSYDDI